MNIKNFTLSKRIIKETFKDDRKIKCVTPDEVRKVPNCIHQGGDVFTTEDGDFIDLEIQLDDFDEDELIKKIEFTEELYERHHRHVSVYLLCPKNIDILMKECIIKSDADFTRKLARIGEDACQIILKSVKNKLAKNKKLDEEDLYALSMLPVLCKREERNYYRKEYFKIINNI